jgi:hypothetical protein
MSDDSDGQGRPDPRKCSGHRSSDGALCGNFPRHGSNVCSYHGGSAPQVRRAAAQRVMTGKLLAGVATLGLAVEDVSPAEILLEEVARSAGAVRWLEARIRELDPDALTWGLTAEVSGRQSMGPVEFTEHRAGPAQLLLIYQAERTHLVNVCKVTLGAGIEERRVQLAEQLGGVVADMMASLLDDLGLSPEQRESAREAVPRRLWLLAGDLNQVIT